MTSLDLTSRSAARSLRTTKIVHTVIWAFFAGCVFAIPYFALEQRIGLAAIFIFIVLVEVLVLAFNGMRCPLTAVAAQYTGNRRDNFDIYLPEWLARHNKVIFGLLYLAGIIVTIVRWAARP